MRRRTVLLAGFFIVLFIAHQDFWWRDDPTLVLGILPVSLAYHVGWTLLVALGWYVGTRFCWPHVLDQEPVAAGPGRPSPDDPAPVAGTGSTARGGAHKPPQSERTRR